MNEALVKELEKNRSEVDGLLRDACQGRREGFAARLAGLVTTILTGIPGLGVVVTEAVARISGNEAAAAIEREWATWNAEQDQTRLVKRMEEVLERVLDRLHIQLVRTQHATKDELLAAVGHLRSDLAVALSRGDGTPPRSWLPNLGQADFVGRGGALVALDDRFSGAAGRLVVVHGAPGTGKSWLALQWARTNTERYPGGVFYVNMTGASGPPLDLVSLARIWLGAAAVAGLSLEDSCRSVLARMGRERTLLVFDQARDEATLAPWLPPGGLACDVLATSNRAVWTERFDRLALDPLPADEARELLRKLLRPDVLAAHGDALIRAAGGLPVQLAPIARALARRLEHGWAGDVKQALAAETRRSFSAVWQLLTPWARLALGTATLFESQHIPRHALHELLATNGGLSPGDATDALDEGMDDGLLESRGDELRIHELVAAFVAEARVPIPPELARAHLERFARALEGVITRPGDAEAIRDLMQFPLARARWIEHPSWRDRAPLEDWHAALALRAIGRFADALVWATASKSGASGGPAAGISYLMGECLSGEARWDEAEVCFRRALDEARSDLGGDGSTELVSASMHSVGFSILSRGQHSKALLWFQDAAEARRHARDDDAVSAQSYAMSVHQVGVCLMESGRLEEALPHLLEALEIERRIVPPDGEDLGRSLHAIGHCHDACGRSEDGSRWLLAAIESKRGGDRFGRVDHDSLGRSLGRIARIRAAKARHEEACALFDEAATEAGKGNRIGAIDHETAARYRQARGMSLCELQRYDEALANYEAALVEHDKGDAHGRRDSQSRGRTLHWIGICLAWRRDFIGAIPYLEQAVVAKRQGDLHGVLDRMSLSWTLFALGNSHLALDRARRAKSPLEEGLAEGLRARREGQTADDAVPDLEKAYARCLQLLGEARPHRGR